MDSTAILGGRGQLQPEMEIRLSRLGTVTPRDHHVTRSCAIMQPLVKAALGCTFKGARGENQVSAAPAASRSWSSILKLFVASSTEVRRQHDAYRANHRWRP